MTSFSALVHNIVNWHLNHYPTAGSYNFATPMTDCARQWQLAKVELKDPSKVPKIEPFDGALVKVPPTTEEIESLRGKPLEQLRLVMQVRPCALD